MSVSHPLMSGFIICFLLMSFAPVAIAQPSGPEKKLIEYGWDVPTPAQIAGNLAAMEKRPFDGLIFRLNGGHNAFVLKPLESAAFDEDQRILPQIQFTRFTNNFVLVWATPPNGFDWFDDNQWRIIDANAKLLVATAQAGHVRGICFDPEPYDFHLWDYGKQPLTKTHTFAEYRAKVRERGAQLMRAFEERMPGATILSFFHVSRFDRLATLSETERAPKLEEHSWGLMPDFFIGMLESASPGARFIDGNEASYYYTNSEQYFRAYHGIHHRALALVPPQLHEKYQRQVQVGQALYVDHLFALRQPDTGKYISYRMTPDQRAKWFEHNTYWALYTTDEFVWCYSERMNWWTNNVPAGLEAAIISARHKIAEGQPLGFDINSLIDDAGKRPVEHHE